MTMRIYGGLPDFDLWIRAEAGQGQLGGVTANGIPVPSTANGTNLGLASLYIGRTLLVTATVLKTQNQMGPGGVTISLYQTMPVDSNGNPVRPITVPGFKFNPWTFDPEAVDLTDVLQKTVTIAIDIL